MSNPIPTETRKTRKKKTHPKGSVRQHLFRRRLIGTIFTFCAGVVLLCLMFFPADKDAELPGGPEILQNVEMPEWVDVQIIPVNGSGRRGVVLEDIQDIVVHYVGNPGSTAQQNHDYYAQATTKVSSHFLVGLDGEVIQCVPLNEKSSASNDRNRDTISIEICHHDDTGKFTDDTYDSAVRLCAWLCDLCGFDSEHIIRHYDITGKECPRYFVRHEDAWLQFLADVDASLSQVQQ